MSQYPPENPYSNPMQANALGDVANKPNRPSGNPSTVLMWQMIYVILMSMVYAACMVGAFFMFAYSSQIADADTSSREIQFIAIVLGIAGAAMLAVYVVGLFWRRGNGGWIYQLVLLAIGLTSCVTWPMTIPLLIGWIKHRDAIISRD